MKRYPEYKESAGEWIGEIPKHWRYSRLKFYLTENSGGIWGDDDEFGNGTYVLRSTEITIDGHWDLQKLIKRKLSKEERKRFLLKKNDLVVTKSSGSQDHIGKTGLVDEKIESMYVCYSNFVQRIRPKNHINSKFLHYFMNCPLAREQYKYQSETTTGLANLSTKSIDELLISLPSPSEQTQIANFLDRKTKQIDELVHIKERQIELLQEQRTALINQTVTKGLDLNVEMKPSGLEWIGNIPVHWEVINTKYLFRLVTEPAPKNNDYELLSIYTSIGVRPRKELEERGNRATTTDGYWLVKKGDFIVNKLLAWMGAIGLSDYEGVTSPAYDILRKKCPLNESFYEYLFRCGLYFTEFKKRSRGIMEVRLRLYFDQFGQIPLVFPPVDEQDEIANFLDQKTEQIDELISAEHRKIELLKEYRQSLISEAVTGKIDVRNEV